jgi:hypothetical protein
MESHEVECMCRIQDGIIGFLVLPRKRNKVKHTCQNMLHGMLRNFARLKGIQDESI